MRWAAADAVVAGRNPQVEEPSHTTTDGAAVTDLVGSIEQEDPRRPHCKLRDV